MSVNAAFASHSPLMTARSPGPEAERDYKNGLGRMQAAVAGYDPELVILFGTDHFYGFFYDTMPAFCIGTAAHSAADYDMPAGALSVPTAIATQLSDTILDADIDIAISHNMLVDHGFTHTLDKLFGGLDTVPVVPIFINCAAAPFPRLSRVQQLGETVGRFAQTLDQRVLLVASGGLSHDPPTPQIDSAPPELLKSILGGGRVLTDEVRALRMERLLNAVDRITANEIETRPLNPDWDMAVMDRLISGDFGWILQHSDADIDRLAGRGAQEIRTWLAAAAAAATAGKATEAFRHYRAIPEWLCGMGLSYWTVDSRSPPTG